jgi:hypothetical protein
MADATLELLRQDAVMRRIKGIPGGPRIIWSGSDIARIFDHVKALPEKMIVRGVPAIQARKPVDANAAAVRRQVSKESMVLRDLQPDDLNFLFIISSEAVDLAGDVITVAGIDCSGFVRNPVVLSSHDSSAMPVAVSTPPRLSGKALTAIAEFPQLGISECSDQTAAALRAKLIKGASVGFQPIEWSFTKDPSRPFGINFIKTKLLEWSVCSIPCNPEALLIGAVASRKPASRGSPRPLPVFVDEESDWQCNGSDSFPLDISDDLYDEAAAKSALLANCSSSDGTILDSAADHFLAVDVSAPLAAKSYAFPFCRVADSGVVASKVGWRKSLAALEKSTVPGMPITDARMLVDRLEARLGDAKTADRRREARALARSISASSITDDPAPTREERLAEAQKFRRLALGGK